MDGIEISIIDRSAEAYNALLIDNVNRFHDSFCFNKMEKGIFQLDGMFSGWGKEDFDFISKKYAEMTVENSPEERAAINLYFGMLKIKESNQESLKTIFQEISIFCDLSDKLLRERAKEKNEKLLKEKVDLERRLKEVNEKLNN